MVVEYLAAKQNFGMRIAISREEVLLDTGGGLKQAAWFFREDAGDEPLLLHNVDVISDIDLARMVEFHRSRGALATLAVQERRSSRQLLFDEQGLLCGRRFEKEGRTEWARQAERLQALAFCGIHVISPRMLERMTEEGAFSIIESYLRLAGKGDEIAGFRADENRWRDVGSVERLLSAREEFA